MTAFTAIDLSLLPAPAIVETLDFEIILLALKADLTARLPDLAPALDLESEPLVKLLEVSAYRELVLRQRVNDAAKAGLLAYATGTDLDQLAAWWGVARPQLTPGDPLALPPVPATYLADVPFRALVQSSLEAHTTAGSIGAYRWHAQRAAPALSDVGVSSPSPGIVLVSLLGSVENGGSPTAEELEAVEAALSADDVRPLCDTVWVQPANLEYWAVSATLFVGIGPAPDVVYAAALAAVAAYGDAQRRVGASVARSAVIAALHQPGVERVELTSPTEDIPAVAATVPAYGGADLTVELSA